MPKWLMPFFVRIGFVLFFLTATLYFWPGRVESPMVQAVAIPEGTVLIWRIPPGTVAIKELPTLHNLGGDKVAFSGKKKLPLNFVGCFAREIEIANFEAVGENAEKSYIQIKWEDGKIEKVPPGTKGLHFSPERRAKEIMVVGYCMHEKPIFRDVPREGTLSWQIRYVSVEN
ncbi:MAG: hypothetical protein H6Q75_527 [Firmicutes bacterium]|nr:hypothetical protein [Bacillota bacterium]